LARTLGVPLFQEQVLRIAMTLADFTGAEADELRRAMGSSRSSERMETHDHDAAPADEPNNGIPGEAQEKVDPAIGSFALLWVSRKPRHFLRAHRLCLVLAQGAPPAEFYAGLINHQPMGFYSVNTLHPGRETPRHPHPPGFLHPQRGGNHRR
jgi:error-prone DNA polymerase